MTKTAKMDSKRVNKSSNAKSGLTDGLRRKVYKTLPAATWSLVQQIDPQWTFAEILAHFSADTKAGVDCRGAARAMQQACSEAGLRSWCYEFGDPRHFTHMVLLVEESGKINLHDPYLDLVGEQDFFAMLDCLEAGQSVALKHSVIQRPYLVDPKLEDNQAGKWLNLKPKDQRGAKLQVSGDIALLENTQPAFRRIADATGSSGFSELLLKPLALLNPAGLQEDARFLAERLGLLEAGTNLSGSGKVQPLLTSRNEEAIELARTAQQQLGVMLDQLNSERLALSSSLDEMRAKHTETLLELATLRETSKAEMMRAAQARMVAEAETAQTTARLNQMKAEVDDALQEGKRFQEAYNANESEKQALLQALDASETERQQLAATMAIAEAKVQARASAEAEGPRSVLAALSVGAAARANSDGSLAVRGRQGGCICYGPYLDLTPGAYRLELEFSRSALAGLLPTRAVLEVVDGLRYLYSSRVKLSGGRTKIEAIFDVPPTDQLRQVEFRVLVGRNSFAILRDIRLEARGQAA